MPEILQVESIRSARLEPDDAAHRIEMRRLSVRREAHDFVLVAVMRKAQILGQRLIEDAERMRKKDLAVDGKRWSGACAPRAAGEIPEAVHRDDGRLAKGRDVKRRGQMRHVVFD